MDTLPSTRHQSLSLKLSNLYTRALNSLGMAKIDLSADSIIAAARAGTGLERFGDESFLPALEVLLRSAREEAALNPFGRANVRGRSVHSLKNRLWAHACFEAHPEILARRIAAPIVIVGPHRSGTTRLQRMLACDGRLQYLRTWEGLNPAPRLDQPDAGRAARYREAQGMLDLGRKRYPQAYIAHPMQADWPEEEMLLLNHSFCGFTPLGLYHVPGYYRWFLDADKTYGYRYMADLMRLISWSRGDPEDKRWLLKNPQHMLDLDTLLRVFPDAKIVFTQRDPIKTVGSVMSLMWHFAVQHTDRPCRAQIRDTWLDFCEQMARRCIEARQRIPADQQIDIQYAEMNRDWRAAMRRIYDFCGVDFSPQCERAMEAWLTESRAAGRDGGHRYSLEDFGLSDAEVDRRMMFVRRKYGIPYE